MKLELKYIHRNHKLYSKAVEIRMACFFAGMVNSHHLIDDEYEENGYHLICLNEEGKVLGTGRLNVENSKGIISQMAVDRANQNKGIGRCMLLEFLQKCEADKLKEVELSARETAIEFYKKFGFEINGKKYPSKKTGIIHQRMIKT